MRGSTYRMLNVSLHEANLVTGCRTQRLPRLRLCRERQEGDRALVPEWRGPDLEAEPARLDLREISASLSWPSPSTLMACLHEKHPNTRPHGRV